jgi:hypothetical protein
MISKENSLPNPCAATMPDMGMVAATDRFVETHDA